MGITKPQEGGGYELMRDTTFGHILRILSRGKVFPYWEDKDPELWREYIHEEKTHNLAKHGQTEAPEPEEKDDKEAEREKEYEGEFDRVDRDSDNEARRPSSANTSRTRTNAPDGEEAHHVNTITGTKIDQEKGKDIHLVHWYGDKDPENPQNWSFFKKCWVTGQICLLTIGIYIGSAIFTSGEQGVIKQFGVSQEVATLGLTLFVAGYGLGPMIWAPLSEIPQIGRNPIYISTLVVFVCFQLAVIFAKNIGMLLAFRFLTGFFGSPVLATGGASLADMWSPIHRAYAITIWGIAAICGPVLGPLVGGFAAESEGWTWTIWELMWLSGFALAINFFFLPETSANNILFRRARRLRKLTGKEKIKSESELMSEEMTTKDIALMTLVRPFTLNFYEPIVFLLNLYIALIYGLLYCWFESFEIVYVEMYGFTLGTLGLAYLGILIGALVVIPPFFVYLKKYLEPKFNENGELKPELRLPASFVGAFCIPICLFWFGWTANPNIPWIVPTIGSAFFSIGAFLLFNSVLNYLPDAYPEYAASVLAGNDLFRSAFGAGFPLFARQMYTKLGVGGASSLLGGLSILFIPIPFLLYKYGERIRKASPRARHDI